MMEGAVHAIIRELKCHGTACFPGPGERAGGGKGAVCHEI